MNVNVNPVDVSDDVIAAEALPVLMTVQFNRSADGQFTLPLPDGNHEWMHDDADLEGSSIRFETLWFDGDREKMSQTFAVSAQKPEKTSVRFHLVQRGVTAIHPVRTEDIAFVAA